jgi:hypothetical protein
LAKKAQTLSLSNWHKRGPVIPTSNNCIAQLSKTARLLMGGKTLIREQLAKFVQANAATAVEATIRYTQQIVGYLTPTLFCEIAKLFLLKKQ